MNSDTDIRKFKILDSTNHFALALIREKKPAEGTVVVAEEQTAGKGMDENLWESEPGKNLLFSVIIYPDFLDPANQFYLNIITSLAVRDAIKHCLPDEKVKIKWPNDVYYENKKISGILIKNQVSGNTLQSAIVGVGININQEKFLSDAPNPISMKMITGEDYNLDKCLEVFREAFNEYYKKLGAGEYDNLMAEYISNMYLFDVEAQYTIMGHKEKGIISGVDEYGRLLIETADALVPCQMKEVVFPLL